MPADSHRLATRILIGMAVGVALGSLFLALGGMNPGLLQGARRVSTTVLDPRGKVFLHTLFLVVTGLTLEFGASIVDQSHEGVESGGGVGGAGGEVEATGLAVERRGAAIG